jgi:hypothetical protein
MKKLNALVLALLLSAAFIACKKNPVVINESLNATKTDLIKKGEPVLFTFSKAAGDVKWNVSPSANTQINASGNNASIMFGVKGNYLITAVSGNVTESASVSVSDSIYTVPVGGGNGGSRPTIVPFLDGETLKINVSKVDSGSFSGLILSVLTTNSYPCLSNSLLSTFTFGTNSYEINFTAVSVPGNCTTGTTKAAGFIDIYPISAGTSTLTINFNNKTYSGTIVKTGSNYVINWAYTSGVTISPTSL